MTENAVEIENLTKNFGGHPAVLSLDIAIKKGLITGIIGADGAGKTTLLRIITGLLTPDEGKITVLGLDPSEEKEIISSRTGYMPQKFGLYEDLTVMENMELYADLKGVAHDFSEMLKFTALEPFQKRLAGKLSGGMKQKLGLACALLGSPELLVLDEPSVGVDPISRLELMRLVHAFITKKTTVIWSTAYMEEAATFDTAVIMDRGRIVFSGAPAELGSGTAEFEKNVIELMGGYEEKTSEIARNYKVKDKELEFPVEALKLCKRFGSFEAVKDNTFKIRRGEIFGLLGPNGAGKTTSFRMMCGLSRASSGTAKIMGIDINKDPTGARANIGYMAQKFSLYGDLTVKENLRFFAGVYDTEDMRNRIEKITGIFEFGQVLDTKSKELPLGFKQRLSMACALIHEPPILFLDEPTSGVDIIARKEFWNHIKSLAKKGVTILVTTHFMEEAEYCDRISLFYKGKTIALGTPAELKRLAERDNMQDAFISLIKRSGKDENN